MKYTASGEPLVRPRVGDAIPDFDMPPVAVGDSVLISRGPDDGHWSPAIVTAVSSRNISVNVSIDGFANNLPLDGVHYYDDPVIHDPIHGPNRLEDSGLWRYTEATQDRFTLRSEVERLRSIVDSQAAQIGSLFKALNAPAKGKKVE